MMYIVEKSSKRKFYCSLCKKDFFKLEASKPLKQLPDFYPLKVFVCPECHEKLLSNAPWRVGYKVLRRENKQLISSLMGVTAAEGGIRYKTKEINVPRRDKKPLCVFVDSSNAEAYATRLFRSYTEVIYKCLYVPAVDQAPSFGIDASVYQDYVPGKSEGTVYADAIILLHKVKLTRVDNVCQRKIK